MSKINKKKHCKRQKYHKLIEIDHSVCQVTTQKSLVLEHTKNYYLPIKITINYIKIIVKHPV